MIDSVIGINDKLWLLMIHWNILLTVVHEVLRGIAWITFSSLSHFSWKLSSILTHLGSSGWLSIGENLIYFTHLHDISRYLLERWHLLLRIALNIVKWLLLLLLSMIGLIIWELLAFINYRLRKLWKSESLRLVLELIYVSKLQIRVCNC